MHVNETAWVDWLLLFAVISFVLGVLSSLIEKITIEYTFFLFLGLAFTAGALLCSGLA